ncbi:RelA/SpoT domain-containing protein [Pseudoalteromonas sp. 20-MNA-CIBAN-0454]|uniref:RelA/SpoT domain-containing protein n=1 Tax=Pseudoalteromonas TaxID=53246 RepID=UPI003326DB98|tara:strand:- start:395 stop:1555 length:1161 start_codon:yes stop_codon:yes gene_type:complete
MYSGKEITKAGRSFLNDEIISDPELLSKTLDVLSYWRSCHTEPLENALKRLRQTVKSLDKNALYAKRLKRYPSIQLKLRRFPEMSLKNMQDVGGCRVIVANSKKVEQVIRSLRTKPEFRPRGSSVRFKDYIKNPKADGYRSYHIIGNFPDSVKKTYRIEVQIRTKIQHYWATALEIIDLFTNQSLKTNQGKKAWSDFFVQISSQFAAMDDIHLFYNQDNTKKLKLYSSKLVEDKNLASSFLDVVQMSKKLKVIEKLNAFANSLQIVDQALKDIKVSGYILIKIDLKEHLLNYEIYEESDSKEAEFKYTEAEKESAEKQSNTMVALVYTDHVDEIKQAYPNFFADSSQFIELLNIIHKSEGIFKSRAQSKSFLEKLLAPANFQDYNR